MGTKILPIISSWNLSCTSTAPKAKCSLPLEMFCSTLPAAKCPNLTPCICTLTNAS